MTVDAVLHLNSLAQQVEVAVAVTESAAALAGLKKAEVRRLGRSLAKRLRELAAGADGATLPLRLLCSVQPKSIDVELRWRGSLLARLEPPPGWIQVSGGPRSCVWRVGGS